jgi:membrane protease YdiL (CAAX protease family)
MDTFLRRAAVLVPYVAVGLGLFLARNAWAALIGYHAGMALFLTLARAWPQTRKLRPGGHLRWNLFGVLIGVCGGIGLALFWTLFGITPDLRAQLFPLGLTPASWPFFILYFSLVNPWLEEIFWRGWLGSDSRSLTANDLWFAGFHLLVIGAYVPGYSLVVAVVVLSSVGWFWRQLARHEATLFPPTLSHLIADAAIALAVYLRP